MSSGYLIKKILLIILFLFFLYPLIVFSQTKEKTSTELIFNAYKNKEINYTDYLFYEVQLIFTPENLPTKFKSTADVKIKKDLSLLLREIKLNWKNFNSEQKKYLKNIFARPTDNPDPNGFTYEFAEVTPYCTTHFCIHYVTQEGTYGDAPPLTDNNPANGIPDYVEFMAGEFENVYNIENGSEPNGLAYNIPPDDGTKGGNSKFDVYIADLCSQTYCFYGYNAPETQVSSNPVKFTSYMVMDDDYSSAEFPQYLGIYSIPIKVTAAHEYHHAIQDGYFGNGPTWFFESTASWVEDEVYDSINDNYQYLQGYFNYPYFSIDWIETDSAPDNGYRDWIFLRYISEKYGRNIIRKFWESAGTSCNNELTFESESLRLCTLNAIDTILQQNTSKTLQQVFADFAARNYLKVGSDGIYKEGASYPDVYLIRTHTNFPVTTQTGNLNHLGSDYNSFTAPNTQNNLLTITFNGPDGKDFSAKIIKETYNGTKTEDEINLNNSTNDGNGYIAGFGSTYLKVILIAINTSKQDNALTYSYGAVISTYATPSATANLTATATNKVYLSWVDATAGTVPISGYNIYRSTTKGTGYAKINSAIVSSVNYTDSNVTGNTKYYYVVRTIDVSNTESSDSNEVSVIPKESAVTNFSAGISMISIPIYAIDKNADSILNLTSGFNVAKWDPQITNYHIYSDNTNDSFLQINPGQGYWLKLNANQNIDVGGTFLTSTYTLHLYPGWNQIGNPFNFNVSYNDLIKFQKTGETQLNLYDAVNKGYLYSYLWSYSSAIYTPVYFKAPKSVTNAITYIEPFKGYWLYSKYEGDLYIPATPAKVKENIKYFDGSLSLQINLKEGEYTDSIYLSESKEKFTMLKPPSFVGIPEIYFADNQNKNAGFFKENLEGEYNIMVETQNIASLHWDNINLAETYNYTLKDEATGKTIDLSKENSWTFYATDKLRNFKLTITKNLNLFSASLILDKVVVFPNPITKNLEFNNLNIEAKFLSGLPLSAEIEIYNLNGKLIFKDNAVTEYKEKNKVKLSSPLLNNSIFSLANGIYFAKISFVSLSGERLNKISKLVILK